MSQFRTITLIVLDSLGIGEAPDAHEYGDRGADTLGHLCEFAKMKVPNLASTGLGNIRPLQGIMPATRPSGFYGKLQEKSKGKGSTEGHWEIMGCVTEQPFALYPNGFPDDIIQDFNKITGRGVLGNVPASGTEIINQLGKKHMETGDPILYTSADSVFQVAAAEEIVPLKTLYDWCAKARKMLTGDRNVVRVIARPFEKRGDKFVRTSGRKDFSVMPTCDTALDILKNNGIKTIGIGKIGDLFADRGLKEIIKTKNNDEGMLTTIEKTVKTDRGLIMTNLVDFDMVYGHRNDAPGYIKALEQFDRKLPELTRKMTDDQMLIITADHGCDPLFKGWDHTRERVPLLVYSPSFGEGGELGLRESFADVGATITENFELPSPKYGESFMEAFN